MGLPHAKLHAAAGSNRLASRFASDKPRLMSNLRGQRMNRHAVFPDDANGDVLRRMQQSGDDLSKPRDIDFTVVMPDERAAQELSEHFHKLGHKVSAKKSNTVRTLPWDVVIVKQMVPTHAEITELEQMLQGVASPLGGRNDGWACFEQ
jgi:hypothetical protein